MSSNTHTGRSEWGTCTKCRLYHTRRNVVLKRTFRHKSGTSPRLMLLGEAPGKTEDATRIPFIGSSGRLLDYILKEISPFFGLATNTVCCRPHDADFPREPTPSEIALCKDHITELLDHYQIQGIVYLGKIAQSYESRLPKVNLMHPAYILKMEYKYYTIQKQRELLNSFIKDLTTPKLSSNRKANNGLYQKIESI